MSLWIEQEALLLLYSVGQGHYRGRLELGACQGGSVFLHVASPSTYLISHGLFFGSSLSWIPLLLGWWLEDKSQCTRAYQASICVTEFTNVPLDKGSHMAKPRVNMGGDITRACIPGGWIIGPQCP